MVEIRISNVEALGKPIGPYSHVARVKDGERSGRGARAAG